MEGVIKLCEKEEFELFDETRKARYIENVINNIMDYYGDPDIELNLTNMKIILNMNVEEALEVIRANPEDPEVLNYQMEIIEEVDTMTEKVSIKNEEPKEKEEIEEPKKKKVKKVKKEKSLSKEKCVREIFEAYMEKKVEITGNESDNISQAELQKEMEVILGKAKIPVIYVSASHGFPKIIKYYTEKNKLRTKLKSGYKVIVGVKIKNEEEEKMKKEEMIEIGGRQPTAYEVFKRMMEKEFVVTNDETDMVESEGVRQMIETKLRKM